MRRSQPLTSARPTAEFMLYGHIDQGDAELFSDTLESLGSGDRVRLRINSAAGDVFEAIAIFTMLVEHPAYIVGEVEGVAAGSSTLILQACSERRICENAHFMVTRAEGLAWGRARDFEEFIRLLCSADDLFRTVYSARSGQSDDALVRLMDHDNWMTAQEALDLGFVDALDPVKPVDADVPRLHSATVGPDRIAALADRLATAAVHAHGLWERWRR